MIVVIPRMEVRAARQSVGFVLFTGEVDKDEIVVGEAGNIACDLPVYMLGVAVILKILMISIDCYRVWGTYEEVVPVSEAAD